LKKHDCREKIFCIQIKVINIQYKYGNANSAKKKKNPVTTKLKSPKSFFEEKISNYYIERIGFRSKFFFFYVLLHFK